MTHRHCAPKYVFTPEIAQGPKNWSISENKGAHIVHINYCSFFESISVQNSDTFNLSAFNQETMSIFENSGNCFVVT